MGIEVHVSNIKSQMISSLFHCLWTVHRMQQIQNFFWLNRKNSFRLFPYSLNLHTRTHVKHSNNNNKYLTYSWMAVVHSFFAAAGFSFCGACYHSVRWIVETQYWNTITNWTNAHAIYSTTDSEQIQSIASKWSNGFKSQMKYWPQRNCICFAQTSLNAYIIYVA